MNLLNIFRNVLAEEKLPEGKTGILLLDIDDTLLKSDSRDIKIYRKLPTDKVEVPLTSAEYAKEHVTKDTKKYYDYRDFRDPQKVYNSIANGAPLLNNLKVVDAFYNGGYDIGILTARGCADAVRKAIRAFLKVRDEKGNLVPLRISPANVHCVNDDDYPYPGDTDFQKKQNVLRKYAKQYNYDYVYFIDDDAKNINALKALKKSDPEIASRLRSIDAKKNMANPIKEEALLEMAWDKEKHKHNVKKNVTEEMLEAINDEDFEKALILYFNAVKDMPVYAGKKDAESALRSVINYGIPKTFAAYEKTGHILPGLVSELKEYGLKNIMDIAKKVQYEGNADYVKPSWAKSTLRKKFMAKSLNDLKVMIEKAESEGYVFKDEPKEGHTAKDGDFFYSYGTIKKVDEGLNFNLKNLLTEMATKDITPEIRKAINDGDYKSALVDYFNNIRGGKTYEKFGNELDKAYDQMRTYGLVRTFRAEERNKKFPEGTAEKLKDFAEKNRDEILAAVGFDPDKVERTYVSNKEKKKQAKEAKSDVASVIKKRENYNELDVIEKRIEDYKKLIKELDDYALTSRSIKPFIVDIRRNGPEGTDAVEIHNKQKLSDIDLDNPDATENERRLAPIKNFRKKFIPASVQKKVLANLDGADKRDLEKAETLGELFVEATKNKFFAQYMSKILNNVVEGYNDFKKNNKGLSDEEALEELKSGVDFPYDNFVKLDKWFKNTNIEIDKENFDPVGRKKAQVKQPEEINKVKEEYISYLNELEKAINNDKVVEFFAVPNNYAVAYGAMQEPMASDFPDRMIKYWENGEHTSAKKLSPTLLHLYLERRDESKDKDFGKRYSSLAGTMSGIMANLRKAKKAGNQEEYDNLSIRLEKCAEELVKIIIDRLIAVDILSASFNSAILGEFEVAKKRYEKIKQEKLKQLAQEKRTFNPKDPKYDKYYDPQGEEKAKAENIEDMYKAIQDSVDKIPFPELAKRRLVPVKGVNLAQKKYNDEEVKELYNALKQGDEKLYELLATDKFRTTRVG